MVSLEAWSDILTAVAYFMIPVEIGAFVWYSSSRTNSRATTRPGKRRWSMAAAFESRRLRRSIAALVESDSWIYVMFGVFIFSCGLVHVGSAVWPASLAVTKPLTAVVSLATAIGLFKHTSLVRAFHRYTPVEMRQLFQVSDFLWGEASDGGSPGELCMAWLDQKGVVKHCIGNQAIFRAHKNDGASILQASVYDLVALADRPKLAAAIRRHCCDDAADDDVDVDVLRKKNDVRNSHGGGGGGVTVAADIESCCGGGAAADEAETDGLLRNPLSSLSTEPSRDEGSRSPTKTHSRGSPSSCTPGPCPASPGAGTGGGPIGHTHKNAAGTPVRLVLEATGARPHDLDAMVVPCSNGVSMMVVRVADHRQDHDKVAAVESLETFQMRVAMMAAFAHDVKTPLTAFQLVLELLQTEVRTDAGRALLRQAFAASELLRLVVVQGLEIANTGSMNPVVAPFTVPDLVGRCALVLEATAAYVPVRLRILDPLLETLVLETDHDWVLQNTVNFLTNSARHTVDGVIDCTFGLVRRARDDHPESGSDDSGGSARALVPPKKTTVSAKHSRTQGWALRVQVDDTGSGVAVDRREQLFVPANTLGEARRDDDPCGRSSGVGLYGVALRTKMLGGRYGYAPLPLRGSRFWFEIPIDLHDQVQNTQQRLDSLGRDALGETAVLSAVHPRRSEPPLLWGDTADAAQHRTKVHKPPSILAAPARVLPGGLLEFEMRPRSPRAISASAEPVEATPLGDVFESPVQVSPSQSSGGSSNNTLAAAPLAAVAPPRRALVVEDTATIRNLLVASLERIGLDVTAAGDGVEGLDLAADGRFDLVLSDINMPNMDGWTMCKRLRATWLAQGIIDIPVLVACTASTDIEPLREDFDEVLAKPVSRSKLQALVNRLFG